MKSRELLRKLRRLGATVDPDRGKGGHIRVQLAGRKSIVPTGSKEIRPGTLFSILRDLGLKLEDLSRKGLRYGALRSRRLSGSS